VSFCVDQTVGRQPVNHITATYKYGVGMHIWDVDPSLWPTGWFVSLNLLA
jgi:hypothetical protein